MTGPGLTITPPMPLFSQVRSIAVLRGGGLGDLLFALPAVTALRTAYPRARVTLLGSALHSELLLGRFDGIDEVVALPGIPGESGADAPASRSLVDARAGHVDLAVQLHGGGRNSNALLLRLGARHTAGSRTPDAPELQRNLDYVYYQHEVLRALEVAALAGARAVTLEAALRPTRDDIEAGSMLTRGLPRPLLAVHPGANDPRRRWPLEAFAATASEVVRSGGSVMVLGGPGEEGMANKLATAAGRQSDPAAVRVAAPLSVSELVGALSAADVFLGNDSGPRHLAQALGTPTVSIFWFGNMLNAGPLTRARHRVQLSWTTHCPVCGRDATQVGWTAPRCEHDVSFVTDVSTDAVRADVESLMAMTVRSRGR